MTCRCCGADRNPAEPISATETACESHSFPNIRTRALFILGDGVKLLTHAMRAGMKISLQREQRVPQEVRGGCKGVCVHVCVCVCVCECELVTL